MHVVTEYIPHRLSSMGRVLSQDEATYIIACVLEALFEILAYINIEIRSQNGLSRVKSSHKTSIDFFYLDENMIGVNRRGFVKVWCH